MKLLRILKRKGILVVIQKMLLMVLEFAKKNKLFTVGFTGKDGGKINNIVDVCINIPSDDTPRIQEAHIIMIGHIICEIVEKELFKKSEKKI